MSRRAIRLWGEVLLVMGGFLGGVALAKYVNSPPIPAGILVLMVFWSIVTIILGYLGVVLGES